MRVVQIPLKLSFKGRPATGFIQISILDSIETQVGGIAQLSHAIVNASGKARMPREAFSGARQTISQLRKVIAS